MDDPVWLEALARVRSDEDDETRLEAGEVFLAEAARCRIVDRVGRVRVQLRGGHQVDGALAHDPRVAGHLVVEGRWWSLVPMEAVVVLAGSRPGLNPEDPQGERTVGSVLREMWQSDTTVRALSAEGGTHVGPLAFVGADHADLRTASGILSLPFASVAAWQRA